MRSDCPCKEKKGSLTLPRKIAVFIAVVLLASVLSISAVNLVVISSTANDIVDLSDELNLDAEVDCVIILGAGLKSNGQPSDMLEDRIKTGVKVFNTINADFILMSGDCSGEYYDEPGAMKKYAISLGVSESDILLDGQGFSTYESILRVKEEYGFDRVVIITQKYHLYRAIYIAEQYDIEAYGVSADIRAYRMQIYRDIREVLARVKDFIKTK